MKLSFKAIISSLLLLLFLFLAGSGALLYFGKTGVVLGLARHTLRNAHALAAALMCLAIPAHVLANRRLYVKELRALGRRQPPKPETEAEHENSQ